MGKGNEGDGKGKGGRGGEEGKGRTPVPDCESAKVATLKCGARGGPPTMPEENRGPWSKKGNGEERYRSSPLPKRASKTWQNIVICVLKTTQPTGEL